MPVAWPATMSGSSMTARPVRVAPVDRASATAASVARAVDGDPSRHTSTSLITRPPLEKQPVHDGEDGHQDAERPQGVSEKPGHAHVMLLGDGLDHEVGAVADV